MLPRGLMKEYFQVLALLLRALDIVAILGAGLLAYYYKFDHQLLLSPRYLIPLASAALLTGFVFRSFNIYDSLRTQSFLKHGLHLLQAIITIFMILTGLAFITKMGQSYSREWVMVWAVLSLMLLILFRCCLLFLLRLMRSYGLNERQIVMIGTSDLGFKLAQVLSQSLWTGFRIVAIFDDHPKEDQREYLNIPILKTPDNLEHYFATHGSQIAEVWFALPLKAEDRVKTILHELRHTSITTRFVLDIFGLDLLNHSMTDLAGVPMLTIRSTPMVGANRIIKAIEDRLIGMSILLLILPLLIVIAVAVKMNSKGPIFYRQKRVGWNGKEFEMLKFRTMPVDTELKTGPVWAKKDEQRATRIGSFLRRTSLDELPQFINVLRGEMSIVGPRPERAFFVEQFKDQVPGYMQKHMVKAGITGWAQINGWRGNTSLEKRIEYDLYYIKNWSLLFDLKIIILTFFRGFLNKNAY